MTARTALVTAIPLAAALLAGCVAEDGFPSLAPRPAERDTNMEPPVRPPVETPSDTALRRRIAELEQQAGEGDRAFDAAVGAAEAATAAAGPAQSESWVEAQVAISRLEAARMVTMRALVDLDQLALARAEAATSAEDFAAINAALATVERIAAGQQQRLDRLRTRVAAP